MAIVEAAEGRLGMLTISEHTEAGVYKYHLVYDVLHPKDENGANQWQSKSAIPLPVNYRYGILGVAGGYLLLIGYPQQNRLVLDYFSLNLQTFQIEWFCQTGRCAITSDLVYISILYFGKWSCINADAAKLLFTLIILILIALSYRNTTEIVISITVCAS
ncbi:hypothetical protein TRIUR3_06612 [Triticum urartu]|uniref:Uncharacterized protein n=1 Tax=Triticum urartu TaxID=4572 RepID=M8A0U3_TRIUA|nr:hypothetical protein TRIUR3_06612 [Triticum urartu]